MLFDESLVHKNSAVACIFSLFASKNSFESILILHRFLHQLLHKIIEYKYATAILKLFYKFYA